MTMLDPIAEPAPDLLGRHLSALMAGDDDTVAEIDAQLERILAREWERCTRPDALAGAALTYASRGIPIFPIEPGRGGPHRKLAPRGIDDATTDLAKVADIWDAAPTANIGAPTGIMFDVVEVQMPIGLQSLYTPNADGYRHEIPDIGHAMTSVSRGMGTHYLFVPPSGLGTHRRVQPGVTIYGTGSFILLPPSLGRRRARHAWIRELRLEGEQ